MPFAVEYRVYSFRVLLGLGVFAAIAMGLTSHPIMAGAGVSPLVVGLFVGILAGNTLRRNWVAGYDPAIVFCAKTVLRIAIVFYGFRITFQEIGSAGANAILIAVTIVLLVLSLGYWVGTRVLKLDGVTSLLTAAGSAICGAAAVVAVESVLRSMPDKSTAALATVVLFGTLGMLLYPLLYASGWLPLEPHAYGVFIGASVHEVAQVVVAGTAGGTPASETAVIVKMTRVLLLVPVLFAILYVMRRRRNTHEANGGITVPWFALGFLAMVGVNSLGIFPPEVARLVVLLDTLLLTMAMTALGLETRYEHLKGMGAATFALAGFLFLVLSVGSYGLVVAFA